MSKVIQRRGTSAFKYTFTAVPQYVSLPGIGTDTLQRVVVVWKRGTVHEHTSKPASRGEGKADDAGWFAWPSDTEPLALDATLYQSKGGGFLKKESILSLRNAETGALLGEVEMDLAEWAETANEATGVPVVLKMHGESLPTNNSLKLNLRSKLDFETVPRKRSLFLGNRNTQQVPLAVQRARRKTFNGPQGGSVFNAPPGISIPGISPAVIASSSGGLPISPSQSTDSNQRNGSIMEDMSIQEELEHEEQSMPSTFLSLARHFIRQGIVQLWKPKQDGNLSLVTAHLYLFNDQIALALLEGNTHVVSFSPIVLNDSLEVRLEPKRASSPAGHAICIVANGQDLPLATEPPSTIYFSLQSPEEQKLWLHYLTAHQPTRLVDHALHNYEEDQDQEAVEEDSIAKIEALHCLPLPRPLLHHIIQQMDEWCDTPTSRYMLKKSKQLRAELVPDGRELGDEELSNRVMDAEAERLEMLCRAFEVHKVPPVVAMEASSNKHRDSDLYLSMLDPSDEHSMNSYVSPKQLRLHCSCTELTQLQESSSNLSFSSSSSGTSSPSDSIAPSPSTASTVSLGPRHASRRNSLPVESEPADPGPGYQIHVTSHSSGSANNTPRGTITEDPSDEDVILPREGSHGLGKPKAAASTSNLLADLTPKNSPGSGVQGSTPTAQYDRSHSSPVPHYTSAPETGADPFDRSSKSIAAPETGDCIFNLLQAFLLKGGRNHLFRMWAGLVEKPFLSEAKRNVAILALRLLHIVAEICRLDLLRNCRSCNTDKVMSVRVDEVEAIPTPQGLQGSFRLQFRFNARAKVYSFYKTKADVDKFHKALAKSAGKAGVLLRPLLRGDKRGSTLIPKSEAQLLEETRVQFDRFFVDLTSPQKFRQVVLLPGCYVLLEKFLGVKLDMPAPPFMTSALFSRVVTYGLQRHQQETDSALLANPAGAQDLMLLARDVARFLYRSLMGESLQTPVKGVQGTGLKHVPKGQSQSAVGAKLFWNRASLGILLQVIPQLPTDLSVELLEEISLLLIVHPINAHFFDSPTCQWQYWLFAVLRYSADLAKAQAALQEIGKKTPPTDASSPLVAASLSSLPPASPALSRSVSRGSEAKDPSKQPSVAEYKVQMFNLAIHTAVLLHFQFFQPLQAHQKEREEKSDIESMLTATLRAFSSDGWSVLSVYVVHVFLQSLVIKIQSCSHRLRRADDHRGWVSLWQTLNCLQSLSVLYVDLKQGTLRASVNSDRNNTRRGSILKRITSPGTLEDSQIGTELLRRGSQIGKNLPSSAGGDRRKSSSNSFPMRAQSSPAKVIRGTDSSLAAVPLVPPSVIQTVLTILETLKVDGSSQEISEEELAKLNKEKGAQFAKFFREANKKNSLLEHHVEEETGEHE